MRRCHHIFDKEVGRVHIPGCWGAAVHGESHCTCYNKSTEPSDTDKKNKMIRELEKENARLRRIIEKLAGYNAGTK